MADTEDQDTKLRKEAQMERAKNLRARGSILGRVRFDS